MRYAASMIQHYAGQFAEVAAIFHEDRLGTARLGVKADGHVTWRYAFNASAPVLPGFARKREFSL